MATIVTLSTKAGYPVTYLSSEVFNIAGIDGHIYVDLSGKYYAAQGTTASGKPEVSLIGVTISAHYTEPKPRIGVGEHLTIGDTTYELVFTGRGRYPNNGELSLVPVE
ncbi:hypothetical protein SEA_QUARTZ_56 [Microbacterium phage Quartz]|nr:hypothetical protein SEA_MANDALORIAN_55 [Microbacterium phage Mandalorian]UVK59275.1 hypothetical protein SEA_QUARTZ_56 [Microbacterium phage Quartz]